MIFTRYYSFLVVGLISSRAALGFVLPSHRATISSSSTTTSFTRSSETTSYVKSPPPSAYCKSSTTTTQLFGWGPDPIWSTAFVESNIQACPSGSCVSLKVNVDDGSEFIYPGQYVQVKPVGGTYHIMCVDSKSMEPYYEIYMNTNRILIFNLFPRILP